MIPGKVGADSDSLESIHNDRVMSRVKNYTKNRVTHIQDCSKFIEKKPILSPQLLKSLQVVGTNTKKKLFNFDAKALYFLL